MNLAQVLNDSRAGHLERAVFPNCEHLGLDFDRLASQPRARTSWLTEELWSGRW
jgi:hypothetical protein